MESEWVFKLLTRHPQFLFSWKAHQEKIWGYARIQEVIEKEKDS